MRSLLSALPLLIGCSWLIGCSTHDTNLGVNKDDDTSGGDADDGDDCAERTWYADSDGDGYGGDTVLSECEAPAASGWVEVGGDCDDEEASVHPEADEVCNDQDDDCDGAVDNDAIDQGTWFSDTDEDGFGDPDAAVSGCDQPPDTADDDTDCDDTLATVNPDGIEVCNDIDDDCNGEIDDAPTDPATWYADTDVDGHGDPDSSVQACDPPTGYVDSLDDCDDTAGSRWDVCTDPTTVTTGTCGGSYILSTYDSGVATTPELHIVGVYEPNPRGTPITVDIDRAADVKLVLSSYEPVTWNLVVSSSTNLTDVVLNGYNTHSVTGAGSATILDRTGGGTYWSACAYGWPSTTGGCDTPSLVSAAESWAGVVTRSFTGCYNASDFAIR
jgi:hypothetical protein